MELKEFENEYLINESITQEVCNTLLKKSKIIGCIIGFFNILGFIVSVYYLKKANYYVLAIGIGCLLSVFLSQRINSKRMIEYSKIKTKGKLEKTKIKFEDCIKLNRGNNYSEFNYNQIHSKIETKNTIILVLKMSQKSNTKMNLIILKNGFIKR